ncbi:TIGR03571 family LLM class oxidoreductase [Salinicola avicenniae]|uniref:TIGR03571 family LLM class oxidoreductase n=1 Tax=Salinicola avicenniae TaxID=2916836 RepID=UPI002073C25D|nr:MULTISPECIES: TIGR03571 family LLM class oxidoreductase [unclassified Salinicola]
MSESIATLANPAGRLFTPGRLSIGLNLPLVRSGQRVVNVAAQRALARRADAAGFRALWVRDVPLNSPDYPDPVGHLDPWSWLGALAVETRQAVLVSGAIVLPLRHPLHIAKAAASVAVLSEGRFVLGLGAGDRPGEFAAFGREIGERRRRFAEHWERVALALGEPSTVVPDRHETETPTFRLEPQPPSSVPLLAVGSGGQSVNWIARHAIGWMTYHREPGQQRDRYRLWRTAVERSVPGEFRAFGEAMRLALETDPDAPAAPISLGYRSGRHALVGELSRLREMGVHHVSLNLELDERPAEAVIDELAAHVLPHFHSP